MNLFCFTLAGSTESIYEPAYSQSLKEVLPKYQCSPALLSCGPEWGGSDPSIGSLQCDQCVTCFFFLTTLSVAEKDISHVCWMSSGDQKDLSHQNKVQSREMREAPCQSSRLTRDDRVKELNRDRTQTDLPAQDDLEIEQRGTAIQGEERRSARPPTGDQERGSAWLPTGT
ncbi:putative SAM domain-containing protein SAMSN-1-like [Scophthalmus maximus]|uniref:Putative SAM domain-containing protein SAMSN-1-like n=1 Tax=Scophthalmus maximus TaxID=52904 RepID=A0A2U9B9M0_SCOMX|nr:putative SAM domain-containing protein SAMSN-1-like [Scophthalmus maximus]